MPNPINSTSSPVYGQAFNLSAPIRSLSTGNPIKTGLTGLVALVQKDDGGFVPTATPPVESGMSGWVSLDLTAAEMAAHKVDVEIQASNASAVSELLSFAPIDLRTRTKRYDLQTVWRPEQMAMDVNEFLWNQQYEVAGQQTVYNRDGFPMGAGLIVEGDGGGSRQKLV